MLAAAVAALGSAPGRGAGFQHSVLPFGLKPGHHTVRAGTTSWTPRDSGRYPVVVIAAGGPAALDQALPAYLASHGHTVVRAPAQRAETVAREFGDSIPVAIVTWGRDTAATALVENHDDGAPPLSIRVIRPADPPTGRLHVVLPASGSRPGATERAYRLRSVLAQAILNATLEAVHPTLSELADRLRAAGVREAYIRAS